MLDKKDFKIIFRLKGEGDKMWQLDGFIETMKAPFGLGPMYRIIYDNDGSAKISALTQVIAKKLGMMFDKSIKMSGLKPFGVYDREFFELLGKTNHKQIRGWLNLYSSDGLVYSTDEVGGVHYFITLYKQKLYELYLISNIIERVKINAN